MAIEPKAVTVRVSVQLREKMVELNLGTYTLATIYNLFIAHGEYSGDPGVVRALELALGYYGGVEQSLRDEARHKGFSFEEVLWVWLAERMEELT